MTMDIQNLIVIGLLLVIAGAAVGFLAGLFGVGGGAVSVPVLYETFGAMNLDAAVQMPLAVGTSLALIVPTSLQSARGHYLRGAMDVPVLRRWALPIVMAVLAGAVVARHADPWVFKVAFILVAGVVSAKLLRGAGWSIADTLPRSVSSRPSWGSVEERSRIWCCPFTALRYTGRSRPRQGWVS
jgi:uncharacterized membrane protein YfcA